MKESTFQSSVIMLAKLHGWLVMHTRAVEIRPGVWKTPLQGHAGYPDLTLAHSTRGVIFAELKSTTGRISEKQKAWHQTLKDAGMEVIYTGLRQTPDMVVTAALQEDVDAIGVSILSGAHMTVFPKIIALMKEKGMTNVLLTGGGIIPDDDMKVLNEMGVGKLFSPGTPTIEIANYIKEFAANHRV